MEVPWCFTEKKTKRSEKKCNCSFIQVKLVILSHRMLRQYAPVSLCKLFINCNFYFLTTPCLIKKRHYDNVLSRWVRLTLKKILLQYVLLKFEFYCLLEGASWKNSSVKIETHFSLTSWGNASRKSEKRIAKICFRILLTRLTRSKYSSSSLKILKNILVDWQYFFLVNVSLQLTRCRFKKSASSSSPSKSVSE